MKAVNGFISLCIASSLALACVVHAQAPRSHAQISSRIFNPATGEYVSNAQVLVRGTDMVAISEDAGYYVLRNIPPGEVTLVVTYTGSQAPVATLNVGPGESATRDFNLVSTELGSGRDGVTVKLDQLFQGKNITNQRDAIITKATGELAREFQYDIVWRDVDIRLKRELLRSKS